MRNKLPDARGALWERAMMYLALDNAVNMIVAAAVLESRSADTATRTPSASNPPPAPARIKF